MPVLERRGMLWEHRNGALRSNSSGVIWEIEIYRSAPGVPLKEAPRQSQSADPRTLALPAAQRPRACVDRYALSHTFQPLRFDARSRGGQAIAAILDKYCCISTRGHQKQAIVAIVAR